MMLKEWFDMAEPFDPEAEGESEDEEDEEESEYEEYISELRCELMDDGLPCDNRGRCVIFNPQTMEMQVCPHFIIQDIDAFEANN